MGRVNVATTAFFSLLLAACSFAEPEASDQTYLPLWPLPGGHGYVGVGRDLSVIAVSLDTGRLWSFKPDKDESTLYGHTQHVVCTPLFVQDRIILRTEVQLIALETATGRLRHRESVERESRFGGKGCPAMAGNEAFLVAADGGRRLRKVRTNGEDVWSVPLPNGATAIGPPRSTGNGDVVVRAGDRIVVWDASGRLKWEKALADYAE
jgi:hypothetical protein